MKKIYATASIIIIITFSLIMCGCVSTPDISPESRAIKHYNNGIELSQAVRYEEAIREYDLALEIYPEMEDAWYGKGTCYSLLGRDSEAINCYKKAVNIDSKYANAWYNKAISEKRMKYYNDALISIERYIDLVPDDIDALDLRDYLIDYLS